MDLFDDVFLSKNIQRIAGVDEAGRGPLAGDVFAAAVVLDPNNSIDGLKDSKKLSPQKRETLAQEIKDKALAYAVSSASVQEIDTLNILQATLLAMRRAIEQLAIEVDYVLIDGNQAPKGLSMPFETVIKGDTLYPCISAASILAKVARDESILNAHQLYPEYGFNQHMGYGTALHMSRLERLGPCPIHRQSFKPVRKSQLSKIPK